MSDDGVRVLVIDGKEEDLKQAGQWLQSAGYGVVLSQDGETGLKQAEQILPDLIVIDALAPKMDGAQLLKKLQATSFGQSIKVLVLSEREKMKDVFDLLDTQGFLQKPLNKDIFLEEVKRVLSEAEGSAAQVYKRVLVIGRYEQCVDRMRKQLEAEGCHTDYVLFGEQAISKAVLFLPNVIIIESRMIDMSSSSIIRILRQMPQFRKVPILVYNYFDSSEMQQTNIQQEELAMSLYVRSCLDEGATESIGPYEPEIFLEKMNKYIKKGSIVAIDDDEGMVRLLKKGLESHGYCVWAARDGQRGLDLVRQVNPSVIILDVSMPDMDGHQLLGVLKGDPSFRNIPVIMLTVKDSDEEIQRALDLGADDYIIKPLHINLLIRHLEMLMASQR